MRIGICGWYGLGNTGDEAILEGMLRGFRAQRPGAEFVIFSQRPQHTQRVHGVPSVWMLPFGPRWAMRSLVERHLGGTLAALRSLDAFVLGGGTLLADWQPEAVLTWLQPAWLAGLLGEGRALYAAGAGPLNTRLGRLMTRLVLDRFDFVSVRNPTSQSWLRRVGLNRQIRIVPDPAVLVQKRDEDLVSKWLGTLTTAAARGNLAAICATPLFYSEALWPGQATRLGRLKADLARVTEFLVRELQAEVALVALLPTVDGPFAHEVRALVSADVASHTSVIARPMLPGQMVSLLEQVRLTVGMRLHSLILSAVAGTPCVGISYHHKCRDFLAALGSRRFVPIGDGTQADNADLDVSRLCQFISEVWQDHGRVAAQTTSAIAGLQKQAWHSAAQALDTLVPSSPG